MSSGVRAAAAFEGRPDRRPVAELLHALNQPLTGLQCLLEVALAAPRTGEHYQETLRDGLALTERMRLLVEALREVTELPEVRSATEVANPAREIDAAGMQAYVWDEWRASLREAAEDLTPVADMKGVRISLNAPDGFVRPSSGLGQNMNPGHRTAVFRLLDAIVALARSGSVILLQIDIDVEKHGFCLQWQAQAIGQHHTDYAALSPPELGLLAAQAKLEQLGAQWKRHRTRDGEAITVRLSVGHAERD